MSFVSQLEKLLSMYNITYTTKNSTIIFKRGKYYCKAHIFDNYKDIVDVMLRTKVITKEEIENV